MSFIKNIVFVLAGFGLDIVTVTSGTAGNVGSVAADLQTYFAAKMLEVAELVTILDQFADKQPIPSNSSKTIHFVREEKFTVSSVPAQLTEGVPPDANGITMNQFEAVAEQYGFLVRISDLAELTAKHMVVERTVYLEGLHAAETYDQLIFNVLDAATNNYRPNGRAGDTSLFATDLVQYTDLVELEATLQDNGGRPYENGDYVFVTAPQVYAGLLRDPDFKAAAQLRAPEKIWKGEIGELSGFRIVRTNSPAFAATSQSTAGQANKVYSSFALARWAYQVSDLQNLRTYIVAPGGQTDPLQQSRKIGWKFAFKSIITNQTWIRRVRSAGQNSSNN
jgi:N4-gp56 family major capsid protein